MTTFYDAAVAMLGGKKIDKSEADRIIELVKAHTLRPELRELDALRSRVESAVDELENVRSSINSLSYDLNQIDRDMDNAMSELEEVRENMDSLSETLQGE